MKGIAFHKEYDFLIFIIIFILLTSVQISDEQNFELFDKLKIFPKKTFSA